MEEIRFSVRLPDKLVRQMENIAGEEKCSRNDVILKACQAYADNCAINAPASHLPVWATQQISAMLANLQTAINNKSNQLISTMAIQLTVIQMILADSLEISPTAVAEYTRQAVDNLKSNNRVFRMDELLE